MNKISNINLGGIPFTIDDDAWNLLQNYMEGLRRVFSNSEGRDEIIADIESRMAELVSENLGTKPIVSMKEVEAAIAVLGSPEQLDGADPEAGSGNSTGSQSTGYSSSSKHGKRLFRDENDAVVAGVCSGIAQYFGVSDPLWVRLAFVALAFTFGSAFLIYAVLWIVVPKALSSADRLAMRGEQVNVNSIAKEVEDGFDRLSRRVNDLGSEAKKKGETAFGPGSRVDPRGAVSTGVSAIGQVFGMFVKVVFTFFKLLFWFIIAIFFIALMGGWIGLIWGFIWGKPLLDYVSPFTTGMSYLALFCGFLLFAIPVFALILLFTKRIFKTETPRWVGPGLAGFWVASLFGVFGFVASGVHKFSTRGTVSQNTELSELRTADTLRVEAVIEKEGESLGWTNRDRHWNIGYDSDDDYDRDYDAVRLFDDHISIQMPIEIRVKPTSGSEFELLQNLRAQGSSTSDAQATAGKMTWPVRVENGKLMLPNFIRIPKGEKWRFQRVEMTLFVPIGKHVVFGPIANDWVRNTDYAAHGSERNWVFSHPNRAFQMTQKGLICPSCPGAGEFRNSGAYHDFSEINIVGNFDVEIEESSWKRSVELEGDSKLAKFDEDGNRLTITNEAPAGSRPLKLVLKTPNLERLFAENFNDISLSGFRNHELELTFLNGKTVRCVVDAHNLTVKQIGNSQVKLIGNGHDLTAILSDGAILDATAFSVSSADVRGSNGSQATVNADHNLSVKKDATSGVKNVGTAKTEENQ